MVDQPERRISTPTPDPTSLTTDAVQREIGALHLLVSAEMEGMCNVFGERFSSLDKRMDLVEGQRVEQKADTAASIAAALVAQKAAVQEQVIASDKAIAKSETSTSEQLKALSTTFTTAMAGVEQALTEIRGRGYITRTEAKARDDQLDERSALVTRELSSMASQVANMQGKAAGYAGAVGIVVSLLAIALRFLPSGGA